MCADTPEHSSMTQIPATAGELIPLFNNYEIMKNVDCVNLMAYDTGDQNYISEGYKTAVQNVKVETAKSDKNISILLGLSGMPQYGGVTESLEQLKTKASWAKNSVDTGGIMFWTIDFPHTIEPNNYLLNLKNSFDGTANLANVMFI